MTDEAVVSPPEFAVVVRGYDRDQVDTYVAELVSLVSELRQEVAGLREELKSGPPTQQVVESKNAPAQEAVEPGSSPSWAGLGPEVARLLEQAEAAATARRQRAEQEAASIVAEARRQQEDSSADLEQLGQRWRDLVAHLERVSGEVQQMLSDARKASTDQSRVDRG